MRSLILLFLLPGALAAADNPAFQEKSVVVGNPFRINIFTESEDELYVISELNPSFLSNAGDSNGEGFRGFSLLGVKPGTTFLSIDRIFKNQIEKKYLYYKINILSDTRSEEIQKAIAKKKIDNQKKVDEEKAQYLLADRLRQAKLYESALREIEAYLKKFSAGSYAHLMTKMKGDILQAQTNYAGAAALYADYLKKEDLKEDQKAEALMELAESQLSNQDLRGASESYLRLVTQYPGSVVYPQALLSAGDAFYQQKRFDSALKYYESFYQLYKDKPNASQIPHMDEALYRIASV
ncbi:MAG: tetratricopeptide repeat protein, partial [Spirochaetia bacterium]|nr:tetratricopeptide repeat protein [Spirochaetia bacterium]